MLAETLIKLFERDLEKLKIEINLYKKVSNVWVVTNNISNSAGTLCLHIIGNLNHFIGSVLGDTGYIRQRELEFSFKDISVKKILNEIDNVKNVIENTLLTLSEEDLKKEYKLRVFNEAMTTEFFLVHLAMHLSYHLGQINYHRRILE